MFLGKTFRSGFHILPLGVSQSIVSCVHQNCEVLYFPTQSLNFYFLWFAGVFCSNFLSELRAFCGILWACLLTQGNNSFFQICTILYISLHCQFLFNSGIIWPGTSFQFIANSMVYSFTLLQIQQLIANRGLSPQNQHYILFVPYI